MDPDSNWQEQLDLAAELIDAADGGEPDIDEEAALRLAELVDALGTWISNGGALPKAWVRHA